MGGGVARFDGCSIEWTVLYDEVIVVLEGVFRLRLGKGYRRKVDAKPGDVVWLPDIDAAAARLNRQARWNGAAQPGDAPDPLRDQ